MTTRHLFFCIATLALIAVIAARPTPPPPPPKDPTLADLNLTRAQIAKARAADGTDAHGHNKGIPYIRLMNYTLNADGTVPYEYLYTRDKHTGEPVFNDSAYDVYRAKSGCEVSREELIDYVDAYLDLNHNHVMDPKEMPHILECLSSGVHTLMKVFKVHPTRMMDSCSVDGAPGVSKSDFFLSEHCLPSCRERWAAKTFVFARLLDGSCHIDPNMKHSLSEVFSSDWAEEIGGAENLQATIDMYGLKQEQPPK